MAMTVEINKRWIQRHTSLSLSESEHTDLIRRACGDPDAFAQLYLLHYQDVFNYCTRRLFDRHSAEDVTSTVFFKVMHNLDSFDGRANDFRSWLFRIATNVCIDRLRSSYHRSIELKEEPLALWIDNRSIENQIATRELLGQLSALLDRRSMEILSQHFVAGMDQEQVARSLGISRRAVAKRIKKIRDRFSKYSGEG